MAEIVVGLGFLALGSVGIVKWREATAEGVVVSRRTAELVAGTRSHSQLDQIPHDFRGIMSLNTQGMTQLNGVVSIRKQSEKKVETVSARVDTPYEVEATTTRRNRHGDRHVHTETRTHTHTHTDRVIESHLYWKLLTRRMLPLGVPNIVTSPQIEGFDSFTKLLRKTASETGTPAQIQSSLKSKFNIDYECFARRRGYNFRWNHYSFNDTMLYFGGRKVGDTFHADKIALAPETIAQMIMRPESNEVSGKHIGAGTLIAMGAVGAVVCFLSRA